MRTEITNKSQGASLVVAAWPVVYRFASVTITESIAGYGTASVNIQLDSDGFRRLAEAAMSAADTIDAAIAARKRAVTNEP